MKYDFKVLASNYHKSRKYDGDLSMPHRFIKVIGILSKSSEYNSKVIKMPENMGKFLDDLFFNGNRSLEDENSTRIILEKNFDSIRNSTLKSRYMFEIKGTCEYYLALAILEILDIQMELNEHIYTMLEPQESYRLFLFQNDSFQNKSKTIPEMDLEYGPLIYAAIRRLVTFSTHAGNLTIVIKDLLYIGNKFNIDLPVLMALIVKMKKG